jgi:hypothetical protein
MFNRKSLSGYHSVGDRFSKEAEREQLTQGGSTPCH